MDAACSAGELRVVDDLLVGEGVVQVPAHRSWHGGVRAPLAIMAHYTATDPGTADAMAKRRARERTADDRAASWHITICADGRIVQMVPFRRVAWHCARGTLRDVDRSLPRTSINQAAIGIELEGHGRKFPDAQVQAAMRVWRALVRAYGIPRELAMLEHSRFDPKRRSDPGPVWMARHAGEVLDAAYLR